MIKLFVKNQYIEFIEKDLATTNSINYYQVSFDFDESWSGFVKHASFFNTAKGDRYVTQIPNDNVIYIPNEVLKTNLPIFIGLYGINGSGVRLTTNTLQIPITIGAFSENPIIVDPSYVEHLEFVRSQADFIQYIREKSGTFEYSLDGVKWTQIRGEAGLGVPKGGEQGQYLVKSSINDYETEWKSFDNEITENSENGASSKSVASFVNNVVEEMAIDILNIKDLFN